MLWRDLKAWQIYGANTDVGKTIISTLLCKAIARRGPKNGLLYLKPVSTGPDHEADVGHISRHALGIVTRCLKQYSQPLSPHLAAQIDDPSHVLNPRTGKLDSNDKTLVQKVKTALADHHRNGGRYAIVETAGGVLSPAPSGSVQADVYRPLRLPVVLVGDAKLGGIATTISAFESLHLRGYDVQSVLLFDLPRWGNAAYLTDYFKDKNITTFSLLPPPEKHEDAGTDREQLAEYYEHVSSDTAISSLMTDLDQKHLQRVSKLTSLPAHAESVVWHPFRQYGLPQNVIAIDSAYDDYFEVYNQEADALVNMSENDTNRLQPISSSSTSSPLLTPLFDASASWWTQGLGHGNPELALTAAHAAGRYGHVMFANAVHEPAIDLCYNLLENLKNPRLSRVFFTDNGSTGMEVAVKMALRASAQRYGWSNAEGELGILGLQGSYHGDTIGVMNCSEPSPFNEKVDWYKPWGHWFSPPEVRLVKGQWQVKLPADDSMPRAAGTVTTFGSLQDIFDFDCRHDDAQFYADFIERSLKHLTQQQGRHFGALILEPLIMGAGGMIFVDPLFQRMLVKTTRSNPSLINPKAGTARDEASDWSGIPVIADEVFTGLYRLGRSSSSSFWNASASAGIDLDIAPDISAHAKLLTGGLLPLALTTASNSIFETFISDSKTDALLHGHSYTAHAIGCSVANKSLETLRDLASTTLRSTSQDNKQTNTTTRSSRPVGVWDCYRESWKSPAGKDVFSFYSPKTLVTISEHALVDSCFAIGTVLALTLRSSTSGYNSTAAANLQARLMTTTDGKGRGVHSRVLGNVIYFMTSLETDASEVAQLESTILKALDGELG